MILWCSVCSVGMASHKPSWWSMLLLPCSCAFPVSRFWLLIIQECYQYSQIGSMNTVIMPPIAAPVLTTKLAYLWQTIWLIVSSKQTGRCKYLGSTMYIPTFRGFQYLLFKGYYGIESASFEPGNIYTSIKATTLDPIIFFRSWPKVTYLYSKLYIFYNSC